MRAIHIFLRLPAAGECRSLLLHIRSADFHCLLSHLSSSHRDFPLIVRDSFQHCLFTTLEGHLHVYGARLRTVTTCTHRSMSSEIGSVPWSKFFSKTFAARVIFFDIWIPPTTADSTTSWFYERLGIPSIQKRAGKGLTLILVKNNVYPYKLFAIQRNR